MTVFKTSGTFEGKPCRKCGGVHRYVKSKKCVACKQMLNSAAYEKSKG